MPTVTHVARTISLPSVLWSIMSAYLLNRSVCMLHKSSRRSDKTAETGSPVQIYREGNLGCVFKGRVGSFLSGNCSNLSQGDPFCLHSASNIRKSQGAGTAKRMHVEMCQSVVYFCLFPESIFIGTDV